MTRLQDIQRLLSILVLTVVAGACAPRQAIIASDPPAGGTLVGVGDTVLTDDIERLVDAQAAYFRSNGAYASRTGDLNFVAAEGVRVDIIQGDRNGFSAIAGSGDFECAIFVGSVRAPRTYVTRVSEVGCRP